MRWSQAYIPTLREDPAEAEVISHKLMLRAGVVRKLAAGLYSYLPLGARVLNKVTAIVREEMDRAGAHEVLLPTLHPVELWEETGRADDLRDILMVVYDRQKRKLVLGPTHEEIITDLVRHELRSYRQLPVTLYQIQTKFRDEPRPRAGVLRSREFIMKDAYSFDIDVAGLNKSYDAMYQAYCRIFDRCGLQYLAVEADTGAMGGDVSHEFMVPCDSGEDCLVKCDACDYAANLEKAESPAQPGEEAEAQPLEEIATPNVTTIEQLERFLDRPATNVVKTLIYVRDGEPVAVLLRGDHAVNETKLARVLGAKCELADPDTIQRATNAPVGFAGPVGLELRIIADPVVTTMANFVTGANKADAHLVNVNLERDFTIDEVADVRLVVDGDPCPKCGGALHRAASIEIGHVFKLGTKYSDSLHAVVLDEQDNEVPMIMGCYGIGVNRIIASAIEGSHDAKGIIWPLEIAPCQVQLVTLNTENAEVIATGEKLYQELMEAGVDVLYDDRSERPGVKFNDADLVGMPVRVTVGKRSLANGCIEIKRRRESESSTVPVAEAKGEILALLGK